MGLISKEVELPIYNNVKYYENLGYIIPKHKNTAGRMIVKKGTKIFVKTKDLSCGCAVIVQCQCDGGNYCANKIYSMRWNQYLKYKTADDKIYCIDCASHFKDKNEKMRNTKLKTSMSLDEWLKKCDIYTLNRWDDKLNKYKPDELSYKSKKYVFLKCPLGIHESEEKNIQKITTNKQGSLDCKQCNSVGFKHPESKKVWSDNNIKNSLQYSYGSKKKVWWKCENNKHEDYERVVLNSTYLNFRCPKCVQERDESFLQEKVRLYLNNLGYVVNHENKCKLRCINPKTNYLLPYDNEIITKDFKLIIEVHGLQHYKRTAWYKSFTKQSNTTPEDDLKYQQWKDEHKKQFALDNGYFYLIVPYKLDNKKEDWKTLIDKKLEKILK